MRHSAIFLCFKAFSANSLEPEYNCCINSAYHKSHWERELTLLTIQSILAPWLVRIGLNWPDGSDCPQQFCFPSNAWNSPYGPLYKLSPWTGRVCVCELIQYRQLFVEIPTNPAVWGTWKAEFHLLTEQNHRGSKGLKNYGLHFFLCTDKEQLHTFGHTETHVYL